MDTDMVPSWANVIRYWMLGTDVFERLEELERWNLNCINIKKGDVLLYSFNFTHIMFYVLTFTYLKETDNTNNTSNKKCRTVLILKTKTGERYISINIKTLIIRY